MRNRLPSARLLLEGKLSGADKVAAEANPVVMAEMKRLSQETAPAQTQTHPRRARKGNQYE